MGNRGSSEELKGTLFETLVDHDESINCLVLSEDESLLISGSEDCTARMWSTKTKETECLGVLRGHTSYIISAAVSGSFVFTASADATVRKWDMTTCECLFVYSGHEARIQKMIVASKIFFTSSYDKTVRAWTTVTSNIDEGDEEFACIRVFRGHRNGVYPLIYIPAQDDGIRSDAYGINPGDILISGSADGTARSWAIDTGSCLKIFKGHTGAITTMSTDVNGKILYTAGGDSCIKSWNIRSGQCLKTMEGHMDSVICLFVTNRLLYTGSADATAKCWVTEFGDCTRTYKGHKHSVICLKFEKGTLFTGSGDGYCRAFEAKSGVLKRVFMGHESAVNAMALANDKLYTGSSDGTLRVWDAKVIDEDLGLGEEEVKVDENEELPIQKSKDAYDDDKMPHIKDIIEEEE